MIKVGKVSTLTMGPNVGTDFDLDSSRRISS